ncbi:hypothetical protein B0H14DRAFT_3057842 [Mycena olivaceomarginata]|nr:hypothetical protein B0H14DRAFT_3057842 [Mycena olivaceomarginata]
MQKLPSPSLSSRPLRENKTRHATHLPGHGLPNTPHCAVRAAVCGVGGSSFLGLVLCPHLWVGLLLDVRESPHAPCGAALAAARACVVGVALAVRVPRAGVRARGVTTTPQPWPKPARVGVVLVKESVGRARRWRGGRLGRDGRAKDAGGERAVEGPGGARHSRTIDVKTNFCEIRGVLENLKHQGHGDWMKQVQI